MLSWTLGALLLSDAFATELSITAVDGQRAVVLVDEYVKGETPVVTDVDGGEVTLAFRKSMFGPVLFSQKVTIPASGSVSFVVDLEDRTITPGTGGAPAPAPKPEPAPAPKPEPAPAPAPKPEPATAGKGKATISASETGLQISVDGKDIGERTPATIELDPGRHVVGLTKGCLTGTQEFTVTAGETETVRVPVSGAKVLLDVKTQPPGADVKVDGKSVGTSPMTYQATCGERPVVLALEGYKPLEKTVSLVKDDVTLDVALEKLAYGSLEVTVDPSDSVIKLDGERIGTGRATLDKVAVGEHALTVERKGSVVQERTVKITEGAQIVLSLVVSDAAKPTGGDKPPKERNGPSAGRLVLNAAVTAASVPLISLGTYNFGQARVAYQDYLTVEDDELANQIFEEEVAPRRNVAYLEWGAGGALLVGGTALWITSFLDAPVAITPTGRGVLLSGRF